MKHLKTYEKSEDYNEKDDQYIIDELTEFFEEEDFSVYLYEDDNMKSAEIEKWTNGGVDMIISLVPFSRENFETWVENFDVDEEIDLHREANDYRNNFTIRESLEDFEAFEKYLQETVKKLKAKEEEFNIIIKSKKYNL